MSAVYGGEDPEPVLPEDSESLRDEE